jgi:hypothetical protein
MQPVTIEDLRRAIPTLEEVKAMIPTREEFERWCRDEDEG